MKRLIKGERSLLDNFSDPDYIFRGISKGLLNYDEECAYVDVPRCWF